VTPGHSSPTIMTASHPSQHDLGHRLFLRAVGISHCIDHSLEGPGSKRKAALREFRAITKYL